jgi:hypothetical protein
MSHSRGISTQILPDLPYSVIADALLEPGGVVPMDSKQARDPESVSSRLDDSLKNPVSEQPRYAELEVNKSETLGRLGNCAARRGRITAGLARFLITASIAIMMGIVASSAWETHSREAKQLARAWALSLISSAKQYFAQTESTGGQKGSGAAVPSGPQESQIQNPASIALEMPPETVQQLKAISDDLVSIRDRQERLATAQEQMTKKMASLQAAVQEIKQKMSSPPVSLAAPVVPVPIEPNRKNASQAAAPKNSSQPTAQQHSAHRRVLADWWITGTRNGIVFVEGNDDIYQAVVGMPLPGLGPVERIIHQNGRWAVVTAKGIIAAKRDRTYFGNLKELEN